MKKIKLFLFLGTLFFVIGCSDEADESKEILQEEQEVEIEKRQHIWNGFTTISPCEASNLTFFISEECAGTPYANAILSAIQRYNSAPISINFTAAATAEEADLLFSCVPGTTCAEAIASGPLPANDGFDPDVQTTFPSGGSIGGEIALDVGWEDCPCTDNTDCNFINFEPQCMFIRTVMHEIGHALGIAHNGDTQGLDGNGTTHIDGTPNTTDDPNSVFNSGPVTYGNCEWCIAPCQFNANDLLALQTFYPCGCEPELLDADLDLCVGETFTYCIESVPNQIVEWTSPIASTGNCITFTAPSFATSVSLNAVVSVAGCEYEITEVINVHENEVCTPPSQPPYDFSQICVGELTPVCYDFGDWGCLEIIEIESSSRKLLWDAEGNELCLNYIWTHPTTIQLEVSFINWCGEVETANWTIEIVNCEDPYDDGDPPHGEDDPPHEGPTAEDCSDFDNPCTCDTAADCPPGWKCIGGGGNKICIEI